MKYKRVLLTGLICFYFINTTFAQAPPKIEHKVNLKFFRGIQDTVVVAFNDSNIEQAVRDELDKQTGDITNVDMAKLTFLAAVRKNISDLTGLEYAVNLSYLYLSNNQISNITPLQNLTDLTELWLHDNIISNITPLQNLTNLWWLWIAKNKITDITALQNLNELVILYMSRNQIIDITALQNLTKLNELTLWNNKINDITALKNLIKLISIYLSNNQISNITALQNLYSLNELHIDGNKIKDITPLKNLNNLMLLYINDNQISDITPLQNVNYLVNLFIINNQIKDLSALQNLTYLTHIGLNKNLIDNEDLKNLYNLENLFELHLNNNPGIISGTAVQTLVDSLEGMDCDDIKWDGTCGVDPDTAVICWISPPDSAELGQAVTIQATATNNILAQMQMKINWGDGNVSNYSEFEKNASTFQFEHSYPFCGDFNVQVIARNEYGLEVNWSEPHSIVIFDSSTTVNAEIDHKYKYFFCNNYPNPFNPSTKIMYSIPVPTEVEISIFNIVGEKVCTLMNEEKRAGYYEIVWDAAKYSSGIYFVTIKAGQFSDIKKMLLIK